LNRQWARLSPDIKKIEGFKKEYASSSLDGKIRAELLAKSTKWSEKLNKLSLNLVPGVWFNEITVGRKEISIKGSVVSLEKKEVDLINKFVFNLKEDPEFMKDLISLDLGSVQKKKIGTFEVVDFSLTAALKPK
jgi:Tfp pilus assembly protein PilN